MAYIISSMRRLLTPARCLLILVLLAACSAVPAVPGEQFSVITHPDGPLYVGDQVSFEVLAPGSFQTAGHRVQVSFQGRTLGGADFGPFGIGGRSEAALWWVWDTHGLQPGSYVLDFASSPGGKTWTETVSLHPAGQVPPPEPGAAWAEATTVCCTIYYITGTDAARDLARLEQTADAQSAQVVTQMHASPTGKLTLVLMPRVLGHGGFTLNWVYVSYLDGNYVDNDMDILLHHEFVHFYDDSVGGKYRPPILEEGLAVYLSGGHFKPEALGPRAGAMYALGWYIPLQTLADDFYNQQHELGYLEAAGLVKYLVDTYGWEAFNRFYRNIPPPDGKKVTEVIDESLKANLEISFDELEANYRASLKAQAFTPAQRRDLQVTVRFFDTVRRYQKALDPSAYFLTAWLPDASVMRQRGIVADLVRHPEGWSNRYLEGQLVLAWRALSGGDYGSATRTLDWVNILLDFAAP